MDITALSTELKAFLTGELGKERDQLAVSIDKLKTELGEGFAAKQMFDAQTKRLDDLVAMLSRPDFTNAHSDRQKSLTDLLIESEGFKAFKSRGWHENKGMAFEAQMSIMERKTTIDTTAVGSATPGILVPQRLPGIYFAGVRTSRVRDLIPTQPTTNNAVDFIRENAFTNAAYPVAEAGTKPEAALTFVIASAPVRTIAHTIPATRQILDDFAQLRDAIDFKLRDGLGDAEDFELLRGDGTGQHITGLMTAATAYDTAKNVASDTKIDTISRALEQLEELKRTATGIVIRHSDWRAMNRIKNDVGGANTGEYILGGPASMGIPTLWNTPVVLSNAMVPGKFLVGDFIRGATLFDRMTTRVDVSNQHSDFFIKNMVMLLCEERVALAVYRADNFVQGSFI